MRRAGPERDAPRYRLGRSDQRSCRLDGLRLFSNTGMGLGFDQCAHEATLHKSTMAPDNIAGTSNGSDVQQSIER